MNWFGFEFSSFLLVFVLLNVVNVIIQTVKSIATIKCGACLAAIINAVAYGLYTVVVVYMNADGLGILWKAVIIGVANLLGVYVVKVLEAKSRKDKLWRIECTVKRTDTTKLDHDLDEAKIPHHYTIVGNHTAFNCYCDTQKESLAVKELLAKYGAKYFVSESKTL
jgi:uncharacterized protein YebE (UPF0316 family)